MRATMDALPLAMNDGDAEAYASHFAEDVVYTIYDPSFEPVVTHGRDAVLYRYGDLIALGGKFETKIPSGHG